jgi:hypothetical protein
LALKTFEGYDRKSNEMSQIVSEVIPKNIVFIETEKKKKKKKEEVWDY